MKTNFGAVAEDYGKFRAGFPDSFFGRLSAFGIGVSGETVIDVGTGTGTLARGFALRGCKVIGIDPDDRLLNQARLLDATASVAVDYQHGYAEFLSLDDESADVISAGQCWRWFDASKASGEFARVIRRGGHIMVAYFSWLPLLGNIVEATERLIVKHNPNWRLGGGNGVDFSSLPHLYAAGFSGFETFSYDLDVPYSPEAWRGRIRASAGIGASLNQNEVAAFDIELARLLEESYPGDELKVLHRVFAIIGRYDPVS